MLEIVVTLVKFIVNFVMVTSRDMIVLKGPSSFLPTSPAWRVV